MNATSTNSSLDSAADVETNHDYDGIREFDNPLPRWWLFTFYGAVVFAVGYWFYYHTLAVGELPMDGYKSEMELADKLQREAEKNALTDDQLLALAKDADTVQRGAALFKQNCVACHGDRGQGIIGPNLTDPYWIHGSKAKQIYNLVSGGSQEKGMPSWGPVLGASKVKEATAFVLSLKGKNEAGKAPQGTTDDGVPAPQ